MKKITLTRHAKIKLAILRQHGFKITENDIRNVLLNPDRLSIRI